VVFLERYNRQSNLAYREEIISVNPCGEQGLGPYGVCNLCSINLVTHVKSVRDRIEVDYGLLKKSVRTAVRLSDNVIEADKYLLPQFEQAQRFGARRMGIGTMGLADLLILKKLRYGSDESLKLIDEIYKVIAHEAYRTSIELARERGSFPWYDREAYLKGYFIQRLPGEIRQELKEHGIRNSMLLTQAPTGTTSILAGVSSGIEPVFSFSYTREDRTGHHTVHHWLVKKFREEHPDEKLPDYFVTAFELTPEEHVRVQAAIQKYVDSSISKTVNAPRHHKVEEVDKLFKLAYRLGCKGITYFRSGTRKGVLSAEDDRPKLSEMTINVPFGELRPIKRPDRLEGPSVKLKTPLGNLLVTLNYLDGRPIELLGLIGKAGSDVYAFTEAIARLVSIALRCGIDPQVIADQLKGIGGSRAIGYGPNQVTSVPDAIGKFIEGVISQNGIAETGGVDEQNLFKLCPECGRALVVESEGCTLCLWCGFSVC